LVSSQSTNFCALSSGFESDTLDAIEAELITSLSVKAAFKVREITTDQF
jgi:hypothetical protein